MRDLLDMTRPSHRERTPHVYFTREEGETAARTWRDGRLPFPAKELVREAGRFIAAGWNHWKAAIPVPDGIRTSEGRGRFFGLLESGYMHLGHHHALTGDRRAATLARDLTERIVERYLAWPLIPGTPGIDYTGRLGTWVDTQVLLRLAFVVRGIRDSGVVGEGFLRDFARRFAKPILEVNTLPAHVYRHDKYHNALTDGYEAMAVAGSLLGRRLVVRDLVGGTKAWTGDELAEETWTGPKGLGFFVANAFNRDGTYWELSSTYAGHALSYLLPTLQLGRASGRRLDPALLRRLGAAIEELAEEIFPNGELPPVNESFLGLHLSAPMVEVGAWLTGNRRLRERLPLLRALRDLSPFPDASEWGKFIHRIFLPGTRPAAPPPVRVAWGDHLHPGSGQLVARSESGNLALHLNWDAYQDYHSDKDALAFCLQYRGRLRFWDSGYLPTGQPYRGRVRRTSSHNTVTVNDEDQGASPRFGRVESYHSAREFTWIRVSAPHVADGAQIYRRSLLVLKTEPFLVVDCFEVEGGWRHAYRLHAGGRCALEDGAKGCRARATWRDVDGAWVAAESFFAQPLRAELQPIFPTEGNAFRKLVLTHEGKAPLRSLFVNVLSMGTDAAQRSRAQVAFDGGGVKVRLPASHGRKAVILHLSSSGISHLSLGGRRSRLVPWKGRQATFSRSLLLSVDAVEGARTIRTTCMPCWPIERGMTLAFGRRRYALEAWQFSAPPLRTDAERCAWEPRAVRLRFTGEAPFRKSDRGAVAELQPPSPGKELL
jgi:hypothetical protein